MVQPIPCQAPSCADDATHRSGWGNAYVALLCIGHTRFRESLGAWSRGIRSLP